MASPMLNVPYDEYLIPELSTMLNEPLPEMDPFISIITAHAIHERTMYAKPPRCIILPEDCEAVEVRPIYRNDKSDHTELGEAITFPTIPYPFAYPPPSTPPPQHESATYMSTFDALASPASSIWASETDTSFASDAGSPQLDTDFGTPASSPRRRMAKTRANRMYGVPNSDASSSSASCASPPPRTTKDTNLKRRSPDDDDDDYSDRGSEYRSDSLHSDSEDEYLVGGDNDASPHRVPLPKMKKAKSSSSTGPKKKRARREELIHAPLGKYECGLIVNYTTKSSRMTIKGLDAPPVGSICPMRCVNRTDLKRHQEAGWHSPNKWSCPFCQSVICNRKDACKRHVETSCKSVPKGSNVWHKLLQSQGLVFKPATKKARKTASNIKKLDEDEYYF